MISLEHVWSLVGKISDLKTIDKDVYENIDDLVDARGLKCKQEYKHLKIGRALRNSTPKDV
jgi:hypothetical protein